MAAANHNAAGRAVNPVTSDDPRDSVKTGRHPRNLIGDSHGELGRSTANQFGRKWVSSDEVGQGEIYGKRTSYARQSR